MSGQKIQPSAGDGQKQAKQEQHLIGEGRGIERAATAGGE